MDIPISAIWPGAPYPIGATWNGEGVNFALFSEYAEKVELCLFDSRGRRETQRIELPERTGQIWHGYLPEARPGLLYGYRVYGPYSPQHGHRFNPHKLLLDPYARDIVGAIRWSDAHFGYRVGGRYGDLRIDRRDDAAGMPRCRVVDPAFTWGDDRPLRTPWHETVICELHVKGFTIRHPDIPPPLRGTYAGLATAPAIAHLQALGITAVELMPVHTAVDDRHLVSRGLSNYWGYNSIGYFAPDARYSATGSIKEFKSMVKALHSAGIEVILDVVYNHTAEGSELGPTLCFRGLDNAAYYRLSPENPRYYRDYTGCGNTLNMQHPHVLQLIMDSLRYWVEEMHVDGFRFDLASALARELHEVDRLSAFFDIIHQDPVLSQVKLIAEPWDLGEGGYQVGNFPFGWAEWNDRYRDAVRAYWKGDGGLIGEFAYRVTGSSDLYASSGRRPHASINFVTAHDGFTLEDLVSYDQKHNDANGEDNRDGSDRNLSWNCGVEGATADPDILALRARQKRNLMATLLLSQGVPMLVAGDILGSSQGGNNNAYCQDNETSWVDWQLDPARRDFLAFVGHLLRLRKRHPGFRRRRFFEGRPIKGSGVKDILWMNPDGSEMSDEAWQESYARCLGMFLAASGLDERDRRGRRVRDDNLLVLFNAHHETLPFELPDWENSRVWELLLDTASGEVGEGRTCPGGQPFPLVGRSMALFRLARPAPDQRGGAMNPRHRSHAMPFGSQPEAGGGVRFRLWAPSARQVSLCLEAAELTMPALGQGWYEIGVPEARPGSRYRFRIDGGLLVPDPASRFNPADVHGPSEVIDPAAFAWADGDWRGRPWAEAVIYELHVGSFTADGTFAGVASRLDELAELGITAIELMPVADFPGRRNWGYDGVLPFAPDSRYGRPEELKALVQAAHARGLMVLLDVVYNHFGPDGNYLHAYAEPFFNAARSTPWGPAINFEGPDSGPVRDFFIHNALYWLEEYHFDGLRIDAVHAIDDASTPDIVEALAAAVHHGPGRQREIHLILENDRNQARYLGRAADGAPRCATAQWNDDFHHPLHHLLTGEKDGYYADYAAVVGAPVRHLARALGEGFAFQGEFSPYRGNVQRGEPSDHLPPSAFVGFLQNHDQIGNRAAGERLCQLAPPDALAAATAILLLAPAPPLLFMGEEFAAAQPFLYFCDFEPQLAAAVRAGRQREFARFAALAGEGGRLELPDPNADATFAACVLDWASRHEPPHDRWLAFYRELLAIRRQQVVPRLAGMKTGRAAWDTLGETALAVTWRLGDGSRLALLANLGEQPVGSLAAPPGVAIYRSASLSAEDLAAGRLPPWSVAWLLDATRGGEARP